MDMARYCYKEQNTMFGDRLLREKLGCMAGEKYYHICNDKNRLVW